MSTPERRRLRILVSLAGVLGVLVAVRYAVLLGGGKPNARQEFQRRERSIMNQLEESAAEPSLETEPSAPTADPPSESNPEQRP